MNLAWKDIQRQKARFYLTALGFGLLFSMVLAMGGIYNGLVDDATLLVNRMDSDLWVVQKDTNGPFGERSTVPLELEDRLRVVPGVVEASSFSTATIQRVHKGKHLRILILGLAWPQEKGERLQVVAGRPMGQAHRELIADQSLGLPLGETLRLGTETYTVVGLTKNLASLSGDGVACVTESDARTILNELTPQAQRNGRDATAARITGTDQDTPAMQARVLSDVPLPQLPPPSTSAILLRLAPGLDPEAVKASLESWPEIAAYTSEDQRQLMLKRVVEKSAKQLSIFGSGVLAVSGVILSLILYTMTVAKTHDIALLKLMGAKTSVVVLLVLEQALVLTAMGYLFALVLSSLTFSYFPRRVLLSEWDYVNLALSVLCLTLLASFAAIRRALRIPPTIILAS